MPLSALDKLSRVLTLAEDPGATPEEAALAMERAQKMASAYSIDLAVARAHQAAKVRELPEKRRTKVGDPKRNYNDDLMELFTNICLANDLQVTIGGEYYQRGEMFFRTRWNVLTQEYSNEWVTGGRMVQGIWCNAYGFPSDHEVAARIYAVAVVQMVSQADHRIKMGDHKVAELSAKTWRKNFYVGFNRQLSYRLTQAKLEAEREAKERETGETSSVALVLADKRKEVDDLYKAENKHFYRADGKKKKRTKTFSTSAPSEYDHSAHRAGAAAADAVNITGAGRDLPSGSRGAIG